MTPSTRRRRLIAATAAAGGIGLGLLIRSRKPAPDEAPDEAVSLLRAQTLPDAQGRPTPLSGFAGRAWLVNFWATWCPPCVDEMPELSALYTELAPKGLSMVGIGIDSASKIQEFSTRSPVSYPLLVAGMAGTELARKLGNPGGALPYTVLIGRSDRIAYRHLGRLNLTALRPLTESLLGDDRR